MATLTLNQLRAQTQDPIGIKAIDTLIQTDQLVAALPWKEFMGNVFSYSRKIANPSPSWTARGGTITADASYKEVKVFGPLAYLQVQQSIDRGNASDAGGLPDVKGRLVEAAFEAMSQSMGTKALTGDTNLTGTITGNATLTASNCASITDVGPNTMTNRGDGLIKFVTATNTFYYRAPGDLDYGDGVVLAAPGSGTAAVKVYSYNVDQWVEVTRGVGAIASDCRGMIVFSGGTSEFDGIFALLKGTSRVIYPYAESGGNGSTLALRDLDRLLVSVQGPNAKKALVMGSRTITAFSSLMRAAGGATMTEYQGVQVLSYNGVPVLRSDFMPITRSRGSSSACSAVVCATFGEGEGLCGAYRVDPDVPVNAALLADGPLGIRALDLGIARDANSVDVRAEANVALLQPNTAKIAVLDGVTD